MHPLTPPMEWQEITLEHEFAEELGEELIPPSLAMHAAINVISPTRIVVNVYGSALTTEPLLAQARERGFRLVDVRSQLYEAHRALATDNWDPLKIGELTIRPVPECLDTQRLPADKTEIRILPGTGWGTGSHPTTALPLELMQRDSICRDAPLRVLDLGCGSGILAIAAERLYHASIDAVDNDALALENAKVNLALNSCQQVTLLHGTIEQAQGMYDLVVANIYAQILLPLATTLKSVVKPQGHLILSGLNESSLDESQPKHSASTTNGAALVLQAYQAAGWKLLETTSRQGWIAYHFRRPA